MPASMAEVIADTQHSHSISLRASNKTSTLDRRRTVLRKLTAARRTCNHGSLWFSHKKAARRP